MNNKSVTLVSGASSGIGLELARLAAADGRNLVLVARRKDKLAEIKQELEGKHDIDVYLFVEDLSDPAAPERIVRELEKQKLAVDALINNAGFGVLGDFATNDWAKEQSMLQVNMVALTALTKLLLPDMLKRKQGKILNVSSTAAFVPGPGMALYYATKAYVQSFSEALSEELRDSGVTVTALCPGPTQSAFASAAGIGSESRLFGRHLPSSESVAEVGYRAMLQGKRIAIAGFGNQLSRFLVRFLPSWLITAYIRRLH